MYFIAQIDIRYSTFITYHHIREEICQTIIKCWPPQMMPNPIKELQKLLETRLCSKSHCIDMKMSTVICINAADLAIRHENITSSHTSGMMEFLCYSHIQIIVVQIMTNRFPYKWWNWDNKQNDSKANKSKNMHWRHITMIAALNVPNL